MYVDLLILVLQILKIFGLFFFFIIFLQKREWQDLHIDLPVDYGKVVLALARIPGLKSAEIRSALVKIPLIEDEVLDLTYKELDPESTTVFNTSVMKPSIQHFDVSKNVICSINNEY